MAKDETAKQQGRIINKRARLIGPPEDRTLRMYITDETRDRYNSIVMMSGWDTEWYRKNPVFLFAHDS